MKMTTRRVQMLAAVIVTAVAITGCASGNKTQQVSGGTPSLSTPMPTLSIPATFENNAERLQFAAKAVMDGYYPESKKLLEQAVATQPTAEGYRLLGTARFNLSDFNGAIEAWTKAGQLDSALESEMQNNIGNAYRDSKKLDGAESAYNKALELEPGRWTTAVNLATMLRMNGRLKEAVDVLEAARQHNPSVTPLGELLSAYKAEMHANG